MFFLGWLKGAWCLPLSLYFLTFCFFERSSLWVLFSAEANLLFVTKPKKKIREVKVTSMTKRPQT